eukprot:366517-Chlamydomonas_euryale.AAC.3
MDEDRLPRQVFDCSLARSVAENGHVEQLKLRGSQGHRNIKEFSGMYSFAIRGCHEEGSGGGTTFRDFLKLLGHTKLIPWPEIRAAAAERALDRQAWRDSIKNLAPLKFKKPQQVGHMTRVRPGSRAVLLIRVQACFMVLVAMIVIWRQKVWKILRPGKPG